MTSVGSSKCLGICHRVLKPRVVAGPSKGFGLPEAMLMSFVTEAGAAYVEMRGQPAGPSRQGKRKSDALERNPAELLALARATQVRTA